MINFDLTDKALLEIEKKFLKIAKEHQMISLIQTMKLESATQRSIADELDKMFPLILD